MPLRRSMKASTQRRSTVRPRTGGEALRRLVIHRQSLRDELRKTCEDIEDGLQLQDVEKLAAAFGTLKEESELLKEIEGELNSLWPVDELAEELQGSLEFARGINLWRCKAEQALSELRQLVSRENSDGKLSINGKFKVKLPKLEIPKFYGKLDQWINFWNLFESTIHNNDSLNNVDKFAYLKAHLGGMALRTIEGLLITSENYLSAVAILQERFGCRNKLIATHMNNLLAIPPLKNSNDINSFRNLFDHLNAQRRCLESLGVLTDSYESILLPLILKLLPQDLLLEFHKNQNTDSMEDLMSFLSQQLSAREGAILFLNRDSDGKEQGRITDSSRNVISEGHLNKINSMGKDKLVRNAPSASALLITDNPTTSGEIACAFCNLNHKDSYCEYAQSVPMDERINILKRQGVCFRCCDINARHLARYCKGKVKCIFCGKFHNTNLCYSVHACGHSKTSKDSSLLLPSLHINTIGIDDLCDSDRIGIEDPAESLPKREKREDTLQEIEKEKIDEGMKEAEDLELSKFQETKRRKKKILKENKNKKGRKLKKSGSQRSQEETDERFPEDKVKKTTDLNTPKYKVAGPDKRKAKIGKITTEALVFGSMILFLFLWNFNPYLSKGENPPDWFVEVEQKQLHVTDEMVSECRQILEEINTKTLGKLVEAKARKKRRAKRQFEKAEKTTEKLTDDLGMTEEEKLDELKLCFLEIRGSESDAEKDFEFFSKSRTQGGSVAKTSV